MRQGGFSCERLCCGVRLCLSTLQKKCDCFVTAGTGFVRQQAGEGLSADSGHPFVVRAPCREQDHAEQNGPPPRPLPAGAGP